MAEDGSNTKISGRKGSRYLLTVDGCSIEPCERHVHRRKKEGPKLLEKSLSSLDLACPHLFFSSEKNRLCGVLLRNTASSIDNLWDLAVSGRLFSGVPWDSQRYHGSCDQLLLIRMWMCLDLYRASAAKHIARPRIVPSGYSGTTRNPAVTCMSLSSMTSPEE